MNKSDRHDQTEAPGGDQRSASHDPEFVRQMRHAEEIMHDDCEVLRDLAE